MKIYLTTFVTLLFFTSFGQGVFPDFLQGTWQIEDKEIYEHWDIMNHNSMKGVSYAIDEKQIVFFEYLDVIRKNDDNIIYTASVVGANDGLGIIFTMTRSDSIFTFENPQHDFPKIIMYQIISDDELAVKISDGAEQELSWTLRKIY